MQKLVKYNEVHLPEVSYFYDSIIKDVVLKLLYDKFSIKIFQRIAMI